MIEDKKQEIQINPLIPQLQAEIKEKTGELDLRISQLTTLAKELSDSNEKLQSVFF